MKKKSIVIGLICLLAVGTIFIVKGKFADKSGSDESQSSSEQVVSTEESNVTEAEGTESSTRTTEMQTSESPTESQSEDAKLPDGSKPNGGSKGNGSSSENKPKPQETKKDASISLPCKIPNTKLVVQNLSSYDGIYLEDGSDSTVKNIAAAVIKNEGKAAVEFAEVTINCDGKELRFEVTDIEPGATVVAQEKAKTSFKKGTLEGCSATVAEVDKLEKSFGKVKVEENDDGALVVTNVSTSKIPCVRVFYKFYMEEEHAYVGGITYVAKLTDVEAGETKTIQPSHYNKGYSKVVMVRTYDTAE